MTTQAKDFYGYRQGVAFAREMLESINENISLAPVIDNMRRALDNKPPAQREGIQSVIRLLEKADIQELRTTA